MYLYLYQIYIYILIALNPLLPLSLLPLTTSTSIISLLEFMAFCFGFVCVWLPGWPCEWSYPWKSREYTST